MKLQFEALEDRSLTTAPVDSPSVPDIVITFPDPRIDWCQILDLRICETNANNRAIERVIQARMR